VHEIVINPLARQPRGTAPTDEVVILSLTSASLLALAAGGAEPGAAAGPAVALAEQVTFVLIPPLVLIFLVLGTIFLGVATPTEGGAMGAPAR
jgi:TRAP-type mannitol/chloroaromatic compound transport system permease large subunit